MMEAHFSQRSFLVDWFANEIDASRLMTLKPV